LVSIHVYLNDRVATLLDEGDLVGDGVQTGAQEGEGLALIVNAERGVV
jgi:hypothetical protein